MTSTMSELVWIKQLLTDLNIPIHSPIKMHCDNQAVRNIATNPVFHERTKYIEAHCLFIREKKLKKRRNRSTICEKQGPIDGYIHKGIRAYSVRTKFKQVRIN
jgi:hypothetical protein